VALRGKPNRPLTTPKEGERLTGRLTYCGRSSSKRMHERQLIAVPVRVSASGTVWAYCTCGWRAYYPKMSWDEACQEGFTRDQVVKAGAIAF
jgi:hypothetical protein